MQSVFKKIKKTMKIAFKYLCKQMEKMLNINRVKNFYKIL